MDSNKYASDLTCFTQYINESAISNHKYSVIRFLSFSLCSYAVVQHLWKGAMQIVHYITHIIWNLHLLLEYKQGHVIRNLHLLLEYKQGHVIWNLHLLLEYKQAHVIWNLHLLLEYKQGHVIWNLHLLLEYKQGHVIRNLLLLKRRYIVCLIDPFYIIRNFQTTWQVWLVSYLLLFFWFKLILQHFSSLFCLINKLSSNTAE